MPKDVYKQKFRETWLKEPDLKNWLCRDTRDPRKAYCKYCKCSLNSKIDQVRAHGTTKKHMQNTQIRWQHCRDKLTDTKGTHEVAGLLQQTVEGVAGDDTYAISSDSYMAEYLEDANAEDDDISVGHIKLERNAVLVLEDPLDTPAESRNSSKETRKESATLKQISDELRVLNATTKSGVEAIVAMGQQMCTLMQQQLEERQRHNALLESILEKQYS